MGSYSGDGRGVDASRYPYYDVDGDQNATVTAIESDIADSQTLPLPVFTCVRRGNAVDRRSGSRVAEPCV